MYYEYRLLSCLQSDEARPELPLTDKKIENFPVGISIDTSAIYQIPNGKYFSSPCYLPIFISIFSGNCTHGPELYANK